MLQKVLKQLNEMNRFSSKIIKWGSLFSILLCIAGAIVLIYNHFVLSKLAVYKLGTTMLYTAVVSFAQIVIGSLFIDYFGKLVSNHE